MPNYRQPVEAAIVNALAKFLQARITPPLPVVARWPDADRTMDESIAVLITGPAESEMFDPFVVKSEVVTAQVGLFTWAMEGLTLPLQLDVWASTEARRDDIAQQVIELMKWGSTFVAADEGFGDPVDQDLDLLLEDGFEDQVASYQAEPPDLSDTSEDISDNQFRARFDVEATCTRTVQAQSARMATIIFRQRSGKQPLPAPTGTLNSTITASATTRTKTTP